MGELLVMVMPYRSFKEKICLVKKYKKHYKVEDWEGKLYMERREEYNAQRDQI